MREQTHILLAEDDINLGHVLSEYLSLKGFNTTLYRDGIAAWDAFLEARPDICILDVMMPKQDGFTLARKIREIDSKVPILFLTAKNLQQDRIEGFELGADDYLTKPFSMQELLLRIKAIMRRIEYHSTEVPIASHTFSFGQMQFTPSTRKLVNSSGQCVTLTNKEARLLHLLAASKNETLARKDALNTIWGSDTYYNARSMDVYITKLRKHLKQDESLQIITVHGEGFKLLELN